MPAHEGGEDETKVTLACTTAQEKKSFADSEPHFLATERIRTLDPRIELHFIRGERSDVVCVIARVHALSELTAYRPRACTGRSTAMTPSWPFGNSRLSSRSGAQATLYVFWVVSAS